jgi:hypothetical protein
MQARRLALATLVIAVPLAGCGGTSVNRSAATASGVGTTAGARSTNASAGGSGPLAFAECMRASGVPNFPDPTAGGGARFEVPAGANPSAPAFRAAQAKCQKLIGGGPPVPGSTTHPSAQTMEKLRAIAVCMRAHGVPQFPDPRTTVPSNPAGVAEITDFDDAVLLFPATIDMQSPAYRQALTACGAPPLGLRH